MEIDVQDIDHLGIIAGIVDEIGIVEIINRLLGTHPQEEVSAGHVVKALILNCLGFLTAPLYLFSQFFNGKATEHLIGPGVKPAHLNDSRIGRVLDQLYKQGLTRVFVEIALAAVVKFGVSVARLHLDSSSMYVHGQYLKDPHPLATAQNAADEKVSNESAPSQSAPSARLSSEPVPIEITHGYSRDHRPDLKQFTLNLITSGDGDVPVYLEVGNGNDADKAVFTEVIEHFKQQWTAAKPEVIAADAALYSAENLQALGSTPWITRVPATITEAAWLMQTLPSEQFIASCLSNYRIAEVCIVYAGVRQRWLVIESQSRQQADLKQLDKRIAKAYAEKLNALKTLTAHPFACQADALDALEGFEKKLKYHRLIDLEVVTKPHYDKPGRPRKGERPKRYTYHPKARLAPNETVLAAQRNQAGRFILATNLLQQEDLNGRLRQADSNGHQQQDSNGHQQEEQWPNDEILQEYKNQQSCERGFRFLKDPLFFASRLFVKKVERVAALAMIMGLCLLVYSLGQRQLRQALEQANETIPNQLDKPIARPTLRWVLQCFQSVHLVWLNGHKWGIKLTEVQRHILRFLGSACQQYYLLC
ncbi:MAG: IS1634 family transposase [Leptolyngbyaceae cyanobacterium MO_188.B28]|nr:IS1634 family transposase [Leptolyngbyaceae cyanobacterium MO_188.B28]